MAVALQCLNLIIPVRCIAARWPGGFAAFWRSHGQQPRLWHDGRLLRDGAMHLLELQRQLQWWQQHGLGAVAGQQDLCIVDVQRGLISQPCDWLELDLPRELARLRRAAALPARQPGSTG